MTSKHAPYEYTIIDPALAVHPDGYFVDPVLARYLAKFEPRHVREQLNLAVAMKRQKPDSTPSRPPSPRLSLLGPLSGFPTMSLLKSIILHHGVFSAEMCLAKGIIWRPGSLTVKGHSIADSIAQALIMRSVCAVVDHLLLSDDMIITDFSASERWARFKVDASNVPIAKTGVIAWAPHEHPSARQRQQVAISGHSSISYTAF